MDFGVKHSKYVLTDLGFGFLKPTLMHLSMV